jgi:hypothetical protein
MEILYFTLREDAAPVCALTRTSQHRLKVGDLNSDGSGRPLILKVALEVDGFLTSSLSARDAHLGKL